MHLRGRLVLLTVLLAAAGLAQDLVERYQRAEGLRERYEAAVENIPSGAQWIGETNRFWYRRSGGGHEFLVVDAASQEKRPAFDHARLAAALSAATGESYEARNLPFSTFAFVDDEQAIQFDAADRTWKLQLADYSCKPVNNGTGRRRELGAAWNREEPPADQSVASPDEKWEVVVRNHNLYLRAKGAKEESPLSLDGIEGDRYDIRSVAWSPDSTMLAAHRVRPGYARKVYLIESSPADQLQPKLHSFDYRKPGDVVDQQRPVLFHLSPRKQIAIDPSLFPNPYQLTRPVWRKDSRAFTFEYNQRGHQVYRVIEVAAGTGSARAVVSEEPETFFAYSGKKFRNDVDDGRELIWMSERDGWNHLYLYDGDTGKVKNQITRGQWVVRSVVRVDETKRQIWFRASGMDPASDPYFNHFYRINFDGSDLVALTKGDGTHAVEFSTDMQFFVDTWSRVDRAPVMELRRVEDGALLAVIEEGSIDTLRAAGWRPPEVFRSKGRDGITDIWGNLYRPSDFDPTRKYPVVEHIYAGPQDSFVPKSFSAINPMQALAELGFIVVQIDGMGTSNRSKAFHDQCWKNLADAGFPDRIAWHKAVAAKYPWYDLSRVGIYGNSAGGQNALGALLFHPDFYHAAVSSAGCHDNRMDKIWWNEQWMGWPLGPEYLASSNVEHAHKLKGKLLLSVGELDDNVDPASTMQVVNALIKAEKTFDLIILPGQRHTPGGPYGDRKRYDFFVRSLLGQEPPNWNALDQKLPKPRGR